MNPFLFIVLYAVAIPALAASPVWLVESGANKLYLGGTVHILRESDYPLPAAFDIAYEQSQRIAFEIDIGETRQPEFQQQLLKATTLPEGTRIEQLLEPSTLKKLDSYLRKNQLSISQFSSTRPSMLALTMTMIELRKLGVTSVGVDGYFYSKALRDGKTILPLESTDQQVEFLAEMGRDQEDLVILHTLREIENLAPDFNNMLLSWRQGDIDGLEKLFIEPMKEDFEPVYEELLVKRNLNWVSQLKQFLKTRETEMVLVGSAHMAGPDGLLQLLRAQGYKITQLD